jgi:hypothetical protein
MVINNMTPFTSRHKVALAINLSQLKISIYDNLSWCTMSPYYIHSFKVFLINWSPNHIKNWPKNSREMLKIV